ncbi:CRISPR-associated endonuclease Cas1 [Psychrobacter celer]|uniref:CRISPR-associated endonuclease Cas1 n=1 Tax=Psychrobacter celer TaxID=306572 RepID=UPI003FD60B97
MHNIIIDKKGSQLSCQRHILLIQHQSFAKPLSIPLSQIQSLTITTQVDLSSNLLTRLSENAISVCVLPSSRSGKACFLLGSWHAGTERRKHQYDVIYNDEARRYWASILVRLKLHQKATTLVNIQHAIAAGDYNDYTNTAQIDLTEVAHAVQKLKSLRDKLRRHDIASTKTSNPSPDIYSRYTPRYQIPSLLGTEGVGSATYFKCYQQFFADEWQFHSRNRRPPQDPVNVVLSLSYTLLQHLCQQAVYSVGFDPYHGVLHSPSYGRESLACDFAELQRGAIDYWVWQLFAQGVLTPEDFSTSDDSHYPCELLRSGRSKFYKAFAAIRPSLSKDALSHAWLWQRRLQRYHGVHIALSEQPTLSFVSHHPEASMPPL